jgi:hypothetical protein
MASSTTPEVRGSYREDLLSGRTLVLHAQSHRSRRGCMPPMSRRSWAHAMGTLANMAASSDRLAQVAAAIIGHVNLYGDDAQACAAMYERAFDAMKGKYDDVIGRAGPEAGKHSSHQHEWKLIDRVAVHYWLALATKGMTASTPGVGWALEVVAKEVGFNPTPEMRSAGVAK